MNIGNKIIELRKKNNLTQEKLSLKIGISRQTLSSWESNITSPNLEQALLLSKEFHISLDELVDNKLDIVCKDNSKYSILNNIVGKNCKLELDDYYYDLVLNYDTVVKVLDVNDNFIKIEYFKKKEKCYKLIDINLIISITILKED